MKNKNLPNYNLQKEIDSEIERKIELTRKILQEFKNYIQYEKKMSIHTLKSYSIDIDQFLNFLQEVHNSLNVLNVEIRHLRHWIVYLMKQGISQRSINRKVAALKKLYKFLVREQYCVKNPVQTIDTLKFTKKLPNILTKKEILNFVKNHDFEKTYRGQRDNLIFELLYGTGMRLSELINVKIEDINRDNTTVKVLGKRNKERIIPLPNLTFDKIIEYLHYRNSIKSAYKNLILTDNGEKAYPMLIYRIFQKYLPHICSRKTVFSPHMLRHTFATHLLDEGADISSIKELLGHSALATTQIYTHVSINKLKDTLKNTHPRG